MKYIYYTIGLIFASVAVFLALPSVLLCEVAGTFYQFYENNCTDPEGDDGRGEE